MWKRSLNCVLAIQFYKASSRFKEQYLSTLLGCLSSPRHNDPSTSTLNACGLIKIFVQNASWLLLRKWTVCQIPTFSLHLPVSRLRPYLNRILDPHHHSRGHFPCLNLLSFSNSFTSEDSVEDRLSLFADSRLSVITYFVYCLLWKSYYWKLWNSRKCWQNVLQKQAGVLPFFSCIVMRSPSY